MFFGGICKICSKKSNHGELCSLCCASLQRAQQRGVDIDGYYCPIVSAYRMDNSLLNLIVSFKYRKNRQLTNWMIQQMYWPALSVRADQMQAVTWLPATPKKADKRGFDQGKLLAKSLSEKLRVPLIEILQRADSDTGQTGLSRDQRAKGPTLRLIRKAPESVVLVDDVVTTKASLRVGMTKLSEGGAKNMVGVTFASVEQKPSGHISQAAFAAQLQTPVGALVA